MHLRWQVTLAADGSLYYILGIKSINTNLFYCFNLG
jgi:hypothetical protein